MTESRKRGQDADGYDKRILTDARKLYRELSGYVTLFTSADMEPPEWVVKGKESLFFLIKEALGHKPPDVIMWETDRTQERDIIVTISKLRYQRLCGLRE